MQLELDAGVAICESDRQDILLIADDHRAVLRFDAADLGLLQLLQSGIGRPQLIERLRDEGVKDLRRVEKIVGSLKSHGYLVEARVLASGENRIFPKFTSCLNTIAHLVVQPLHGLSTAARGWLLNALLGLVVLGISTLWFGSPSGFFYLALNEHWWIGALLSYFVAPIIHEFGHVLIGHVFSVPTSCVGLRFHNVLQFRPYADLKRSLLSSNAYVRAWIPFAGIFTNLCMLLVALYLAAFSSHEVIANVAATLTILLHWRVLVDASRKDGTDGYQLRQLSRLYAQPNTALGIHILFRSAYLLFVAATLYFVIAAIGQALHAT